MRTSGLFVLIFRIIHMIPPTSFFPMIAYRTRLDCESSPTYALRRRRLTNFRRCGTGGFFYFSFYCIQSGILLHNDLAKIYSVIYFQFNHLIARKHQSSLHKRLPVSNFSSFSHYHTSSTAANYCEYDLKLLSIILLFYFLSRL